MPAVEHLRAAVLDTHAWIWLSAGDERAASLKTFRGRAVVSAISVWEVAMLESKGRLDLEPTLEEWVESNLRPPVELEPIHPAISIRSCQLADFHGDPADRLIVATAIVLGVPLITADAKIIEWSRRNPALQVIEM
jgi:PIN domain nuclease of toxin-antitoxin system